MVTGSEGVAISISNFESEITQQRFGDLELPPSAIGIGLHTGEAIAGIIGSPNVWSLPPSAIR
jgi:class 3 adenylate cyclase